MAKEEKKEEDKKPNDKAPAAAEGAEGAGGADGAAAKKKSKKKLMIIAAAAVVVLVAGGAAAYLTLGTKAHKEEDVPKEKPIFYTMPEMIINLSTAGKSASFLKATVILELPRALDAVAVEASLPRLMDAFNTYIRELRPSDLSGSAGITRLREELLLRANKALEPSVKVNDVLFKQIMVQ